MAQVNNHLPVGHIKTMMGPDGLYQHATGRTPLLPEGYCIDDNTRAVQVFLQLGPHLEEYISRCWQFIVAAEIEPGQYRNFRTVGGEWLPHGLSDDMYARLARCFVTVIEHDADQLRVTQAKAMLDRLRPSLAAITVSRGWAETALALSSLSSARLQINFLTLLEGSIKAMKKLWLENASPTWPWFEKSMTYANALLPHGVMKGFQALGVEGGEEIIYASTNFLVQSTLTDNMLTPIGNHGWYVKDGQPARHDQQPIEAGTMFDFLIDYDSAFPGRLSASQIAAPYLWFWGHNAQHVSLIDPVDSACYDGLRADAPNRNCGAESLLAYLWAEVRLRDASKAVAAHVENSRPGIVDASTR